MAALVRRYADLLLGGTHAAHRDRVERLGTADVTTIDHRYHTIVRPRIDA
jgi:hypothetical protein